MPYADEELRRQRSGDYHKKKRLDWVKANGGQCKICGSKENLRAFSDKDIIPHNIWSWGSERREKALKGCIVLCAIHHRRESIRRQAERFARLEEFEAGNGEVVTQQAMAFDPSEIAVEGKEVIITVTIKVV